MTHALSKDVGCFKVGTRTMEKVRCIFQLGRASCSSETICAASFLLTSTAYAESTCAEWQDPTTSAKAVGPICVLQAGRRMQVPSSQISKPLKRLLNNMILIQVCLHHRPQLNSSQKNLNSSGDTDSQPERLLLQRRLEQNQFGSILRCSPCQEC